MNPRKIPMKVGTPRWRRLTTDETLDEVTNRVMEGLPRFQAIEALHGYQDMKSVQLSSFVMA